MSRMMRVKSATTRMRKRMSLKGVVCSMRKGAVTAAEAEVRAAVESDTEGRARESDTEELWSRRTRAEMCECLFLLMYHQPRSGGTMQPRTTHQGRGATIAFVDEVWRRHI